MNGAPALHHVMDTKGSTVNIPALQLSAAQLQANSSQSTSAPPPPPGPYTQREEALIKREAEGDIAFHYVENDGSTDSFLSLTALKNIFSKQLPNMPKEYICRLVFDRRHRSAALVKRSGAVVGGITYRAFHEQGFGEIAFCAITSSEQVKGYGTRLMNHAKQFARTRDSLTHFLTYADNAAVGYFEKQGFTKAITLERERWTGYIKDYDGGTLMECIIHTKIPATEFPSLIRVQRSALHDTLRGVRGFGTVHPGLTHWGAAGDHNPQPLSSTALVAVAMEQEAVGGGSSSGVDGVFRPIESIPGVVEAGWTPEMAAARRNAYRLILKPDGVLPATPQNLQRFMTSLLEVVQRQEDAWPFREAVPVAEAPDYYDVIKNPIDLSLMESRLKSGRYYRTLEMFNAEFTRMFDNCREYNAPDTIYVKLANKLEALVRQFISNHVLFNKVDL